MMFHLILTLLAAPGCLEVSEPRITAGHLKSAVPEFASIQAAAEFGYAPAPGATRWIRRGELEVFARRYGVGVESPTDVCVVRPAQPMTPESAEVALRLAVEKLIPGAQPRIEVVDFTRMPLPRGDVLLSPRDIEDLGADVLLWRGRILFDRSRSAPVWVKARVLLDRPRWFARRAIEKGETLRAEDVEIRTGEVSLLEAYKERAIAAVEGLIALSSIEAGGQVHSDALTRPPALRSGDTLKVISETGNVRLVVEARALQAGRVGDSIPVENKSNGRILRARITARNEARVLVEENRNETDRHAAVPFNRRLRSERQGRQETDSARGDAPAPVGGASVGSLARQPL